MTAVVKGHKLYKFNVSEDLSSFRNPQIGAIHIPAHEGFCEIEQSTLDQLVQRNHQSTLPGYEETYLEFFPDEIFIEKSFKNTHDAEQFIEKVFNHFEIIDKSHCRNIIERLRTFTGLINSPKKLNCRFEVISGNSCKKFHVDTVDARLIYTCAGPGTQLKKPEVENFITLESGSALIVKGEEYPEFKLTTLHRSPPIEGKNIKRFLFIADYQ